MTEIFKTDYVNMIFDDSIKVVHTTWLDSPFTSDQYKEVFNKAVEFATNTPCDFYLSDIVNQKVITPEDRKWFEEVAIPAAIATGIKKSGIILGANPFKRYYFNNIMKRMGGTDLPFKAFKDKEAAYKWFIS